MRELLHSVAQRAARYLEDVNDRRVGPSAEAVHGLDRFLEPLPDGPTAPEEVIRILDDLGSPATMGIAGPRFFGVVIGGALPAALAANWLASAWDQNAGLFATTPVSAVLEEVSLSWLLDALCLPPGCGGAFVTGATVANFTALAAARHAVLDRAGWDVESNGLFGAPEIQVVVSEEAHPSVFKALGMLGMGRERVIRTPVDSQGRMRADRLPELRSPAIVCMQAGPEICRHAHAMGAWVHVDGAFGLWAAASPRYARLVEGVHEADSWATDAHKWLNVPYDSGLAFVRNPESLRAAMSLTAAYLPQGDRREPSQYVAELSRRARGVDIWAALKSLGRSGLCEMIERNCRCARRFADGLSGAGFEILNDVMLNQVLVSFGPPEKTQLVVAAIRQGRHAMRISVSSWATTEADVDRSLEAIVRIARERT